MKYIFDKKIFYFNLLICVLLVGNAVYSEGYKVLKSRTETLTCPLSKYQCQFLTGDGKLLILKGGEEITLNKFNQKNLNIANYGVWIFIFISLIANHLIYNKNYPIKKEIKKIIEKIKI